VTMHGGGGKAVGDDDRGIEAAGKSSAADSDRAGGQDRDDVSRSLDRVRAAQVSLGEPRRSSSASNLAHRAGNARRLLRARGPVENRATHAWGGCGRRAPMRCGGGQLTQMLPRILDEHRFLWSRFRIRVYDQTSLTGPSSCFPNWARTRIRGGTGRCSRCWSSDPAPSRWTPRYPRRSLRGCATAEVGDVGAGRVGLPDHAPACTPPPARNANWLA